MKRNRTNMVVVIVAAFLLQMLWVSAAGYLNTIQVTLKGGVFCVNEVTTVKDLQERLEEELGLTPEEQGRVTFQGKVLSSNDALSDAGLQSGDQVNIIPKKMADHLTMMENMGKGLMDLRQEMLQQGIQNISANQRREFKVMTNLYQDLAKAPFMQEEMERFCHYLKDPNVAEKATDPDRVESLRQIILNNPVLLQMLSDSSPSTRVALHDPEIWLRHVVAAVDQWKTLDAFQLWQRLIEGRLFGF